MSAFVEAFHVLVVSVLFLYVGIYRNSIVPWMYGVLLGLGLIIVVYHIYKLWLKGGGLKGWVNWIHVLLIGPLLIYIGYTREKTARLFYEIVLMLGFAALGYHGYYLALEFSRDTKGKDSE
jgi:hypothetical protein